MKKYEVKKGEHYFSPRTFGIHTGKREQGWRVRFTESALYDPIDAENDWNKGGGWSYGVDIHKDSIRWGWRADKAHNAIEICVYVYQNGVRTISKDTLYIPVEQDVFIWLKTNGLVASVFVREFETGITRAINTPFTAKNKWGRWSGLYFGGNNPAGQNMIVYMDKLK